LNPGKLSRMMNSPRRPFWIYSSSYYIFAAAICIATFFLVWGLLLGEDETPWIPAGILASLILILAVVLRELVLRKLQRSSLSAQKRSGYSLNNINKQSRNPNYQNKITLEKNAAFIKQIANKSKTATTLDKSPDAHLEVFEMCNAYLHLNQKELETTGIEATKLAVFRRGREKIQGYHKFHLLTWASIESNLLIQEARNRISVNDKLENAQRALNVLNAATKYYPSEKQVIDSIEAVKEFIVSIRVSHWVEQAERSAFKENYQRAINHYRDALFFLARENERSAERDLVAQKINFEIEKLREFLKNKKDKENLPS
jgi:hypothetical protein